MDESNTLRLKKKLSLFLSVESYSRNNLHKRNKASLRNSNEATISHKNNYSNGSLSPTSSLHHIPSSLMTNVGRDRSNDVDSINTIFNNKYYCNDVRVKLVPLSNEKIIKERVIQKSLLGNDPRYSHMKKMTRFWDCLCNYACPRISILKYQITKDECSFSSSQNKQSKIRLIKLPLIYTNSCSQVPVKKKLQPLIKVYSNLNIKRISLEKSGSN